MKRKIIISSLLIVFHTFASFVEAQVTIGSELEPEKGAVLDIKNKPSDTGNNSTTSKGGLVLPRVKLLDLEKLEPVSAQNRAKEHMGMIVYNISTDNDKNIFSGIYQWDGSKWRFVQQTSTLTQPWYKVGTNIASTLKEDDSYLRGRVVVGGKTIAELDDNKTKATLTVSGGNANINKVTIGQRANTSSKSVSIGSEALSGTTEGMTNTAIGYYALAKTTTGANNTAVGNDVLKNNTLGKNNTAIGPSTGNNLTTGSNNLIIGANSDVPQVNATLDSQINIGNLIFGKHGKSLGDIGQIGINKQVPTANLHVGGNMRINRDFVPEIRGFAPLIVGIDGSIGTGVVLPILTLNTLVQSVTTRRFTYGGKLVSNSWVESEGDIKELNENRPVYANIVDDIGTELISNTLIDVSESGKTIEIREDVKADISGYLFFQTAYLYLPNDNIEKYKDPFETYSKNNNNYISLTLYLEHTPVATGIPQVLTTGNQIWYGAPSGGTTVKIIQLQSVITDLRKGDKLRWYLKRGGDCVQLWGLGDTPNIQRPAGGKYTKGISILALSNL